MVVGDLAAVVSNLLHKIEAAIQEVFRSLVSDGQIGQVLAGLLALVRLFGRGLFRGLVLGSDQWC